MTHTIFRVDVGDSIALRADALVGDVLVNKIEESTDNDCLTVSLWITGLNGTDTIRQL